MAILAIAETPRLCVTVFLGFALVSRLPS